MELISYIWNDPMWGKLARLLLTIIVVWGIAKLLKRNVTNHIKENEQRYKTNKALTFLSYVVIILVAASVFSKNLGNLTVALGVAGAGIAFALQEVIASFAGWLAIMFGGFYKTGDRVQLGGIKGDVIDIGMLRTTLMETGQWVDGDLYNGRIVRIANSFVFKEPVFNYSGDFPFLWDEIKIPIQYGSDYQLAEDLLLQIAKNIAGDLTETSQASWNLMVSKYMIENAQTAPMVTLIANDNWVEYTIRYVVSYKKRRLTKTALFKEILKQIEGTQGKIKFASATFHLVEAPEISVKIK